MLSSTTIRQSREEEAAEAAKETGADPAIMAATASVFLSWYFFFVRGDTHRGLFVGLWPPTILAFASYFNQTRMADKVERAAKGGSVVESLEQMIGSR